MVPREPHLRYGVAKMEASEPSMRYGVAKIEAGEPTLLLLLLLLVNLCYGVAKMEASEPTMRYEVAKKEAGEPTLLLLLLLLVNLCYGVARMEPMGAASSGNALSRTQLPLQLAWAITIHKSQGQTYDKATVNLGTKELQLGMYLILALCQMHDFDCGFKTCASEGRIFYCRDPPTMLGGMVALATCSDLILSNA